MASIRTQRGTLARALALLVLCQLSIVILFPRSANAHTCKNKTVSLEQAFINSSFVFIGTVERHTGRDAPFKITHVYKTPPEGLPSTAQVYVSAAGSMGGFGPAGKEWLIFGSKTTVTSSAVNTTASMLCGPSRRTTEAYLTELLEQKKNPKLFSKGASPVIFTGRVKQTQQWSKNADDERSHAIVDFEILELFRNAPAYKQTTPVRELKGSQAVSVFMSSCGDAYRIGHSYLVYALHGAPRDLPGYPTAINSVFYSAKCRSAGSLDLAEKEILLKLSQQHKPY